MARKSRKGLDAIIQPPVPKKTVYQVGMYVRLSVEDKKHKGDSIDTQQAIMREFIDEHDDLELREIYIDNGLSGQSFNRPAFTRMKEDIESGLINCCITKDLSRLGRNAIDTGFFIETYFPRHGVRYIAITDDYDSINGQSGGIMVSLKNMVNETIALEAGRKIRAYHQMLTREGGFSGAHAPYGYAKAPNDVHQLVPDEYASEIVRRIFDMYASGTGVTAILEWLNSSDILTPKQYFDSLGVGTGDMSKGHYRWAKNVVTSILSNRVYCGDIVRGKNKTNSRVAKRMPESEWIIIENKHEAIISRELFDKVRKIRESGNNSQNTRYETPVSENAFKGKIVCGHCGRSLERVRPSEHIYKFRCPTRYSYAKSDCVPVLIKETVLKEKLLDMLRFVNFDATRIQNSANIEAEAAELQDIQTERYKNQRHLDSLYESLVSGDITDSEYREMKTDYSSKISELIVREKTLRQAQQEQTKRNNTLSNAGSALELALSKGQLTAEIIDSIVEKIRVFSDRSLMVKFTFMDREIPSREVAEYEEF